MFASAIIPLVLIGGWLFVVIWLLKHLASSFKKHPDEHTSLRTLKSTQELADIIKRVARELNANIEKVQDDPLGEYGNKDDIAVVLVGKTSNLYGNLTKSSWAVQIYIKDNGDSRTVDLVALSDQASAYYSGIETSESRDKCAIIAKKMQ